jgi:hypothetical protein
MVRDAFDSADAGTAAAGARGPDVVARLVEDPDLRE